VDTSIDPADQGHGTGVSACFCGLLLVDKHVIVREALAVLLGQRADLRVLAQASTLSDTVGLAVFPDVIVTELELPDASGEEVVRVLRSSFGRAAILILTQVTQPAKVERVLAAGADGYVLKTAEVEDLLAGINAVARGETYLQPSLGVEVARHDHGRDAGEAGALKLSPREESVLRLLALGHTNAEIARLVGVSRRTVESHRAHIHQKLGSQTRAELVRFAHTSGLLDDLG
jgi:two-component system, NarL family, response regulator NreC